MVDTEGHLFLVEILWPAPHGVSCLLLLNYGN